jgi:hypothetical protein
LVYQKDITILNICTSNNKVTKYVRQKLTKLKREIEKFQLFLEMSIVLSQQLIELNKTSKSSLTQYSNIIYFAFINCSFYQDRMLILFKGRLHPGSSNKTNNLEELKPHSLFFNEDGSN